jgi:hypothetical protein
MISAMSRCQPCIRESQDFRIRHCLIEDVICAIRLDDINILYSFTLSYFDCFPCFRYFRLQGERQAIAYVGKITAEDYRNSVAVRVRGDSAVLALANVLRNILKCGYPYPFFSELMYPKYSFSSALVFGFHPIPSTP